MPRDSQYTDKILAYMKREKRPVTAPEIAEGVGMSRQAAYQWVDGNAWRLREVGTGKHNARAYLLTEDADALPSSFRPSGAWQSNPRSTRSAPAVPTLLQGDLNDLSVGQMLTVSAIRLLGGAVVIDLATETGHLLTVALG